MEDGWCSHGTTGVSKDTVEYMEGNKTDGSGKSDMEDGIKLPCVMGRNEFGEGRMDDEEENRRDIEEETISPNVARMVRIMKNDEQLDGNEN